MFLFEGFRVRKLVSINALNFCITLCMAFLAHISMKPETNALKVPILQKAAPIKEKVHFWYYRLARGISGILSYAKESVGLLYFFHYRSIRSSILQHSALLRLRSVSAAVLLISRCRCSKSWI